MAFQFGNIVVVDDNEIGVIVKAWADGSYDVYVRSYNSLTPYKESEIKHYVYSKKSDDSEGCLYD